MVPRIVIQSELYGNIESFQKCEAAEVQQNKCVGIGHKSNRLVVKSLFVTLVFAT